MSDVSSKFKVIFMADSHLGFDFPVRKTRTFRPRRGADFFANFQRVLQFAKQNQADMVIHGGDLFFRSKIPQKIVDNVYQILFNFAESGIPLLIVPGNHERGNLPPSVFLNHPNLHVFHRPNTVLLQFNEATVRVDGFPHVRYQIRDRFKQILSHFNQTKDKADICLLCFHQTVEGATTGPRNYRFKRGPEVIPLQSLPEEYDLILSGHMHKSQFLGRNLNEKRILYAGSIERTSFAEIHEEKGFWELVWHKNQYGWQLSSHLFHLLPVRPMVQIKIPTTLAVGQVEEFLTHQLQNCQENSIVRVDSEFEIDLDKIKPHISSGLIIQKGSWKRKNE